MTVQLDRLFPNAGMEQCFGFLGCAGAIAANTFFGGGRSMLLRAGNWCQNPDESARAKVPDVWVDGINRQADGTTIITLEAVVDKNPLDTIESAEVNPFDVPMWQTDHPGTRRASTIDEVLDATALPMLTPEAQSNIVVVINSFDPFYAIPKLVSNFFGVILARGGKTIGISIFRGSETTEMVPEVGNDSEGKLVTRNVSKRCVPVYLVIQKSPQIELDDVLSIRSHESSYDPTWGLEGLLTGRYAKVKTFKSDGSER